jgi:YD repeat-containing protein
VTSTFEGYGTSYLAPTTKTAETGTGNTYIAQRGFDTAGNTKDLTIGSSLAWSHEFDEAGNPTKAKQPARGEQQIHYDGRGNVTNETLPGGATQSHEYHPTGAPSSYKDPGTEVTSTTTDELGRPTIVNYVDGTTEKIEYEGANVLAVKDHQDR